MTTTAYAGDFALNLTERERICDALRGSWQPKYLGELGWRQARAEDKTRIIVDRDGVTVAVADTGARGQFRVTDSGVRVSTPRGVVALAENTVLDFVDFAALSQGVSPAGALQGLSDALAKGEQRENAREQRLEDAIVRRRRTANRNIDREEAAELYGDVAEVEPLTGDAVVEVVAVAESFMVESLWSYTRPQVLLYAKAKVGKSTLAHNVVAALLAGTRLFGRYRVEAPAGRIGIIDTEMTAEHLTSEFGLHWPEVRDNRDRVKLWALGQKGAARQFDLTDPARRVQWAEKLRAEQIDVLVVDCLGPLLRAAGVKENEDAAVFMEHIREVCDRAGVKAHMIVDHASSKADGLAQGPRGDSKKQDTADALWKFYGAKTAKGEPVPGRFVLDVEGRDGSAKIDLYRETDGFRFHKVFYEDDPQYQVDADAHDLYPAARRALSAAGPLTQTKLVDAVYSTVKGAEGPGRERVRLAVKNLATQRCLTTTAGGDRGAITYAIGEGRPIKPTRPLPRADNGTYGGAPLTVSGVDNTTGA